MSFLRSPTNLLQLANLAALGGMTAYFKSHHDYNLQEHEARMDELEGTLRGHIGLIEDALERIEGKKMDGQSKKAYVCQQHHPIVSVLMGILERRCTLLVARMTRRSSVPALDSGILRVRVLLLSVCESLKSCRSDLKRETVLRLLPPVG